MDNSPKYIWQKLQKRCIDSLGTAVLVAVLCVLSTVLNACPLPPPSYSVERMPDIEISSASDLQKAITSAPTGNAPYVIALTADITLTSTLNITCGKNIALIGLTGPGEAPMLGNNPEDFRQLTQDDDSPVITIHYGGQLILSGITVAHNIVHVDGLDDYLASGPGVYVNEGGLLIIESGFIHRNHSSYFANNCGGGVLNYGTFMMTGGTISSNEAKISGGGVANYGILTMSGGAISGNTAEGGGAYHYSGVGGGGVANYATFTMTGGTISNNIYTGDNITGGGGVYNNASGTLTMTGGRVSGNAVDYGGGIFNHNIFVMADGTISGNTADTDGGGVYNFSGRIFLSPDWLDTVHGAFAMKGGTISDNTAGRNGGGVYTSDYYIFTTEISDVDIIFSNNRAWRAYPLGPVSYDYAVYCVNIVHAPQAWTAPFEFGYNNFDIYHD